MPVSGPDGRPGDRPRGWSLARRRLPALLERPGLVAWLALWVVLGTVYGWASWDEERTYAQRGAYTTAPVLLVDDCAHPKWGSIEVEVLGRRAYLSCTDPLPRAGDRLQVQYDTANPRVARRAGSGDDSVALVLMSGGGAACALVLTGWVLLRRLQARLHPEVEERFRADLRERAEVQVRTRWETGRGPSWRWPSHRGRHRR